METLIKIDPEKHMYRWYSVGLQTHTYYVNAYRAYYWPVHSIKNIRLAPFHLLESEGTLLMDKNHVCLCG